MSLIFSLLALMAAGALWIKHQFVVRELQAVKNDKKEIEQLLIYYTDEMKRDNERLRAEWEGGKHPAEEVETAEPVPEMEEAAPKESMMNRVIMLYKDGWKEKDIAKTLSIGQREVHLFLQMQEK
ncbi:DUF6115 domain-containing protein [Marinococcus luteus]|uniref:DUF6115 domain-containing protein n=1 Tax=Marinococcus luteus TaxID=1122204 RepID=UPI002ACD14E7|nr:hypothetical protein [Marinococcus luteus]MDZ5781833.1 hypothetical protein [Marinococcus luteus]